MKTFCTAIFFAALMPAASVLAANGDMQFKGTLVVPPVCTISSGNTIDVDFGDVGVNKVDGINYIQPVNYTVSCTASTLQWATTLTLSANAPTYDPAAVQTDVTDLAIQIQADGKPFTINQPIPLDPAKPPVLKAVPVKKPGSTLTGGAFKATATLLAVMQ